jgi:hypothetical protein
MEYVKTEWQVQEARAELKTVIKAAQETPPKPLLGMASRWRSFCRARNTTHFVTRETANRYLLFFEAGPNSRFRNAMDRTSGERLIFSWHAATSLSSSLRKLVTVG